MLEVKRRKKTLVMHTGHWLSVTRTWGTPLWPFKHSGKHLIFFIFMKATLTLIPTLVKKVYKCLTGGP